MPHATVKSFGVSAQIGFGSPVTAPEADLARRSREVLSALQTYGLKTKDVTLSNGDGLFSYQLQLSLFGGVGSILLTSEELQMAFQGARAAGDWNVIFACLFACNEHLVLSKPQSLVARVDLHATFSTEQERDHFVAQWCNPPPGFGAGGLVVHSSEEPFELVETRLERSTQVETGVYFSCRGVVRGFIEPALFAAAWELAQAHARKFALALDFQAQ